MKNPQTPPGIGPATFRFVAQRLNHCATAVPLFRSIIQNFPVTTEENQENSQARRCHCWDPNAWTPTLGPMTWLARTACHGPEQSTVLRVHLRAWPTVRVPAVMSQHLFMKQPQRGAGSLQRVLFGLSALRIQNLALILTKLWVFTLSSFEYLCDLVCLFDPSVISVILLTDWLSYFLSYLLTPCSRVLLEKLPGSQLVKKFPAFYLTQRFITASQQPATCPYPEPHKSSPWPPCHFLKIYLILCPHLRLGLPSGLFPSGFPRELCIHLSSPPYMQVIGSFGQYQLLIQAINKEKIRFASEFTDIPLRLFH